MRKLLVALIVLIALLVGADFLGRAITESKTGEAIARQGNLNPGPTVDIHGFSFLEQAVRGNYEHVSLTANDLRSNGISGIDVDAELYEVKLPLSDALGGNIDNLTATRADVVARIPAAGLATVLNRPSLRVTEGAGGTVQLGTEVSVGGAKIPVSALVDASVADNTLTLSGKQVVAGTGVGSTVIDNAVKQLKFRVPLNDLPVQLDSGSVTMAGDTLVISAATRNVKIGELIGAGR